ncbi:ankyrin repeat-containing domain protein [Phaeosphaeriaceae sp. PMI808]|nr:ankyrin repeat-containing domain protein [Phaeosphaeriaceae sp. PMI808]
MSNSELPELILSAIRSGNFTQLQELCQPDMSLEKIAQQAAQYKQPQILEWCCAQGWAPPPKSSNNQFFISAITGASPTIFQVLVDHGWDLNAHESEACGDDLASAVMDGSYDFAKWLLKYGHRATPHDPIHGPSAISTTIRGETASIEMLKLLLDHGFALKESGAGIAVAGEGNLEVLRLLLDHGVNTEDREMWWYPFDDDRDEPDESQGTALYRACRQGRLGCVELLLD